MTKYFCDRCKEQASELAVINYDTRASSDGAVTGRLQAIGCRAELCESCLSDLKQWLAQAPPRLVQRIRG